MSEAPRPKMSFEDFQTVLAQELGLAREDLRPGASFVHDLQVDSLALASLMLRLEELGISIPLERAWEIQTVGEAYRACIEGMDAPSA